MKITTFLRCTRRQNLINHFDHIRSQVKNLTNNSAIIHAFPGMSRNQNLGCVTIGFVLKVVPTECKNCKNYEKKVTVHSQKVLQKLLKHCLILQLICIMCKVGPLLLCNNKNLKTINIVFVFSNLNFQN